MTLLINYYYDDKICYSKLIILSTIIKQTRSLQKY